MDRGLKKFALHSVKSPFSDNKEKQKAYRELFSSELGGKVLQDILSESGHYSTYVPNANYAGNAEQGMFAHGKRFVTQYILNQFTVVLQPIEMTAEIENFDPNPLTYNDYD